MQVGKTQGGVMMTESSFLVDYSFNIALKASSQRNIEYIAQP